jgi:hypothetical protein
MAGLTPNGLDIKRLEEIKADMITRARSPEYFGPGLAAGEDTPIGHIFGLTATPIAEVWELAQQEYDSRNPNAAEGISLDNLGSIVGVEREPARKTAVTLTCTGTNGTLIPQGSIVRITNGASFITDDPVTIPVSGTIDVAASAEEYGPIEAPAGTVDDIVTVIAGWDAATNAEDGTLGRLIETDEDYRLRRLSSLQGIGNATDLAIQAHISDLDSVDASACVSNRTLVTDSNGIPGKAFRVVVWPVQQASDELLVAEEIWRSMPSGIYSDGAEAFLIQDSQGYIQTVRFSYAVEVDIYVTVNLTYDGLYTGDDAVKGSVLNYGSSLSIGGDVILLVMLLTIANENTGIVSMEILASKTGVPGPSDDVNIPISVLEIAAFDVANITVNSTPA